MSITPNPDLIYDLFGEIFKPRENIRHTKN